jgi:two-component system, sensor histidine kinase and response regulator
MTTQRHRDRGELDERLVRGSAAVIATDLDGVITHWTAGAQRLYGWTGQEAIGNPLLDLLVAPGDRQTAAKTMESVRHTGDWEGEFDLRRKGGGIVLAYVRSTVIKDDAGRQVGVLDLSMDLSTGVSGRA